MFKAIRDLFRKTCKDCEYYSYYKKSDKLLPDKKVIRREMLCESCKKMDCRLKDFEVCEMFKPRSRTHNSFHAVRVYHR